MLSDPSLFLPSLNRDWFSAKIQGSNSLKLAESSGQFSEPIVSAELASDIGRILIDRLGKIRLDSVAANSVKCSHDQNTD